MGSYITKLKIIAAPEHRVKFVGFSCTFPLALEFWREIYLQYATQKKDQDGSAPPNSVMSPARWVRGIYLDYSPLITSRPIPTLDPSDEDNSTRQEHLTNSLVGSFCDGLHLALVRKADMKSYKALSGILGITRQAFLKRFTTERLEQFYFAYVEYFTGQEYAQRRGHEIFFSIFFFKRYGQASRTP